VKNRGKWVWWKISFGLLGVHRAMRVQVVITEVSPKWITH